MVPNCFSREAQRLISPLLAEKTENAVGILGEKKKLISGHNVLQISFRRLSRNFESAGRYVYLNF